MTGKQILEAINKLAAMPEEEANSILIEFESKRGCCEPVAAMFTLAAAIRNNREKEER